MRKTPLSRGTKGLRRTPFKRTAWVKTLPKRLQKPKIERRGVVKGKSGGSVSPILKINLRAKFLTWNGYTATRYKGLKGLAWTICSKYIRKRDGGQCSTCPNNRRNGYQMQAGHYQPIGLVGSNNKLSWDEMNIHCQCATCNGQGEGEQEKMGRYIWKKYGHEVYNSIWARRNKVDPVENWEQMVIYYFNKLRGYDGENGVVGREADGAEKTSET